MLKEYAWAMDGTGQGELPDCMANVLFVPPLRLGGPKPAGNVAMRVSAIRQGVIPTNTSELGGVVASGPFVARFETVELPTSSFPRLALSSAWFGCQYNGAGHDFTGIVSRWTCATTVNGSSTRVAAMKRRSGRVIGPPNECSCVPKAMGCAAATVADTGIAVN